MLIRTVHRGEGGMQANVRLGALRQSGDDKVCVRRLPAALQSFNQKILKVLFTNESRDAAFAASFVPFPRR